VDYRSARDEAPAEAGTRPAKTRPRLNRSRIQLMAWRSSRKHGHRSSPPRTQLTAHWPALIRSMSSRPSARASLSDRQRAVEEFSRLPGVDKVGVIKTKEEVRRTRAGAVALTAAPTRTFEVFMNVQTTPGEVAAVRAAIEGRPGVVGFEYLDKPAAYQEFKRIFRNDPDLKTAAGQDSPVTRFPADQSVRAVGAEAALARMDAHARWFSG